MMAMFGCKTQPAATPEEFAEGSLPIAEWDTATIILMHTPGIELFDGIIHPSAGLFEDYFNVDSAAAEHQGYIDILRSNGCRVMTVAELLAKADIEELRPLADAALRYESSDTAIAVEAYRQEVLSKMSRNDLIRTILLRPTVQLRSTGSHNTGVEATYIHNPLSNLYFMRDQSITTPRGTILCRMNSTVRADEVGVVRLCHKLAGNEPIYEVHGDSSRMEGGDYMPAGTMSMIGCGMRTTIQAIQELMDNDCFGHDTVVVVRDHLFWQMQMHLDTHFNIIDRNLVTMCANRYDANEGDPEYLTMDIYVRPAAGKPYALVAEGLGFRSWLESRGTKIIRINHDDEMHYANNYLTIAPRHICAIANQSQEFQDALAANNVKVDWIPAENLICGYGAAHCMTQVIRRK